MRIQLGFFGNFMLSFLISGVMTLLGYSWWLCLLTAIVLTTTIDVGLALANTTCTTIGNTTYCTNSNGGSTTCTRVGNQTYCN